MKDSPNALHVVLGAHSACDKFFGCCKRHWMGMGPFSLSIPLLAHVYACYNTWKIHCYCHFNYAPPPSCINPNVSIVFFTKCSKLNLKFLSRVVCQYASMVWSRNVNKLFKEGMLQHLHSRDNSSLCTVSDIIQKIRTTITYRGAVFGMISFRILASSKCTIYKGDRIKPN